MQNFIQIGAAVSSWASFVSSSKIDRQSYFLEYKTSSWPYTDNATMRHGNPHSGGLLRFFSIMGPPVLGRQAVKIILSISSAPKISYD